MKVLEGGENMDSEIKDQSLSDCRVGAVEKLGTTDGITYDRKPSFPTAEELLALKRHMMWESDVADTDVEDLKVLDEMLDEACIAIFHSKSGYKKVMMVLFPTRLTDYRTYAWVDSQWKYVGQSEEAK